MNKLRVTREMAKELADCIKNPPCDWRVWKVGAYIKNSKVYTFATYHGQGLDENIYNETYDSIWEYEDPEGIPPTKKEIENFIYDACKEWIDEYKEKIMLDNIYTFSEACSLWGLGESTLRKARFDGRFQEGEIRQSGSTWLVTSQAMERLYGVRHV